MGSRLFKRGIPTHQPELEPRKPPPGLAHHVRAALTGDQGERGTGLHGDIGSLQPCHFWLCNPGPLEPPLQPSVSPSKNGTAGQGELTTRGCEFRPEHHSTQMATPPFLKPGTLEATKHTPRPLVSLSPGPSLLCLRLFPMPTCSSVPGPSLFLYALDQGLSTSARLVRG